MATTKMWKVESRLDHVLDYVSNEAKTMKSLYDYVSRDKATDNRFITCINCSSENPYLSMMNLKEMYHDESNIIAYHAVQSFKQGEGTPELVHEIGKKLIKRVFNDRYQVVICTHLDKEHLHNHFIINPISIVDGKRYHNSKKDIYTFRNTSDALCKEYGLSIIDKPKGKGKTYKSYNQAKSFIREIKCDIDSIVNKVSSLNKFYEAMYLEGYEYVVVDGIDCIIHPNYSKPIPLSTLGSNYYDESKLQSRIFGVMDKSKVKYKIIYSDKDMNTLLDYFFKNLLKGYQKTYAEFQIKLGIIPNLKITKQRLSKEIRKECRHLDLITNATTLLINNNISNIDELNSKIVDLTNQLNNLIDNRKDLYTKSYKEVNDLVNREKLKQKAKELTPKIKELRYQIKCLEDVKTRSLNIEKYNKVLLEEKQVDLDKMTPFVIK